MNPDLIHSADIIGKFCRMQLNSKRDLPIRASEMGVLIYIQRQSEPVTPLMISQFFNITKPSVSSMVKTLLKHDYLRKIQHGSDHRSYLLTLTKQGIDLVSVTFDSYFQSIEKIVAVMGDESFQQFIRLMNIAILAMEEESR